MSLFCDFKYFETPVIDPPVPIEHENNDIFPFVCLYISVQFLTNYIQFAQDLSVQNCKILPSICAN